MTTTEINWRQVVSDLRALPDDMAAAFRGSIRKWLNPAGLVVDWYKHCAMCDLSGYRHTYGVHGVVRKAMCERCPLFISGVSDRDCNNTPFEDLSHHIKSKGSKYVEAIYYTPDCPECNRLRIAELHTIIKSLRWFAARERKQC